MQVYSKLQVWNTDYPFSKCIANKHINFLAEDLTWEESAQGGACAPRTKADTSRSTGDRIWDKETIMSSARTVLSRTCMNTIEHVSMTATELIKSRASRQGTAEGQSTHIERASIAVVNNAQQQCSYLQTQQALGWTAYWRVPRNLAVGNAVDGSGTVIDERGRPDVTSYQCPGKDAQLMVAGLRHLNNLMTVHSGVHMTSTCYRLRTEKIPIAVMYLHRSRGKQHENWLENTMVKGISTVAKVRPKQQQQRRLGIGCCTHFVA